MDLETPICYHWHMSMKNQTQFTPQMLEKYKAQGVDVTLLLRRLSMTPQERIEENFRMLEVARELQRANSKP